MIDGDDSYTVSVYGTVQYSTCRVEESDCMCIRFALRVSRLTQESQEEEGGGGGGGAAEEVNR